MTPNPTPVLVQLMNFPICQLIVYQRNQEEVRPISMFDDFNVTLLLFNSLHLQWRQYLYINKYAINSSKIYVRCIHN